MCKNIQKKIREALPSVRTKYWKKRSNPLKTLQLCISSFPLYIPVQLHVMETMRNLMGQKNLSLSFEFDISHFVTPDNRTWDGVFKTGFTKDKEGECNSKSVPKLHLKIFYSQPRKRHIFCGKRRSEVPIYVKCCILIELFLTRVTFGFHKWSSKQVKHLQETAKPFENSIWNGFKWTHNSASGNIHTRHWVPSYAGNYSPR